MLVFFFILSSLLCPVMLHSVLLNLISKPVIFHIFLLPQARPKTSWSWWPACWQLTDSLEAPSGRTHKNPRNHSGGRRRDILPEFACSLYTLETFCISLYLHLVHETLPCTIESAQIGMTECWRRVMLRHTRGDARRHREATAGSTAKSLEHWQTLWRRMNWKSIRLVGHPSHKSSSSSREKKHSPPRRSTAPSCRLHRYGIWGWTWGINYTSSWQYSDKGKKMILIGLPVPLEDGCKETSVRKTTNYHEVNSAGWQIWLFSAEIVAEVFTAWAVGECLLVWK